MALFASVPPLPAQHNAFTPLLSAATLVASASVRASESPHRITLSAGGAQVRFVQVASIARQLDAGAVVLLSNLGFSAAGEVLNCDIYQVHASCTYALCTSDWLGDDTLAVLHDDERLKPPT